MTLRRFKVLWIKLKKTPEALAGRKDCIIRHVLTEVKASREAEEEAKVKATEGEFPVSKEDTKGKF